MRSLPADIELGRPLENLPMALWELHADTTPGTDVTIRLRVDATTAGRTTARRTMAGRTVAGATPFQPDHPAGYRGFALFFEDMLTGAGFKITSGAGSGSVQVRRLRTLADTVGPRMRLLLVGLNPSIHAADSGVGFSGPSNRGWPALMASSVATVDRDPAALLATDQVGMTDLVKRATATAGELDRAEYRDGLARLERLCAWLAPSAVCVVGLSGWRIAVDKRAQPGHQARTLGGRPVWLMPNPSGLNARCTLAELTDHFRSAAALAERTTST